MVKKILLFHGMWKKSVEAGFSQICKDTVFPTDFLGSNVSPQAPTITVWYAGHSPDRGVMLLTNRKLGASSRDYMLFYYRIKSTKAVSGAGNRD